MKGRLTAKACRETIVTFSTGTLNPVMCVGFTLNSEPAEIAAQHLKYA
jgi:hypothetical protein